MEKGKPYTTKGKGSYIDIYGGKERKILINKGTRYPHSILRFNNPHETVHNTQKPVDLIEWLIKSYSNEGDVILDLTMGSGSTGVACKNTKRYFIGIEKDEEIFKTACERLNYKS
jgi:site-specific DNA-methyltransferase (adenine-specific)